MPTLSALLRLALVVLLVVLFSLRIEAQTSRRTKTNYQSYSFGKLFGDPKFNALRLQIQWHLIKAEEFDRYSCNFHRRYSFEYYWRLGCEALSLESNNALTLAKRYVAGAKARYGAKHGEYAVAIGTLASVYGATQQLTEAEQLYKQALATYEKVSNPSPLDVGRALNGLASLYRRQRRFSLAEPVMKRALATYEKGLRPDNLLVLTELDGLAELALEQESWTQAADQWRRGTDVVQRRAARGVRGGPWDSVPEDVKRSRWPFAPDEREALLKHIDITVRLTSSGRNDWATLGREAFETAQWAQDSDAAQALAQMAVRASRGVPALAALVRERQDLVAEWQTTDMHAYPL